MVPLLSNTSYMYVIYISILQYMYVGSLDSKRKPVCIYGWSGYPDVALSYLEIRIGGSISSLCELWKSTVLELLFSLAGVLYLVETNSSLYQLRASYHVLVSHLTLLVRSFVHYSFSRNIVWYTILTWLCRRVSYLMYRAINRIHSIHISYTYQNFSSLNTKNFLSKRFEIQIH